jgi:hypothetical protein
MPTGVGSRIGRGTATAVPSRFSPRHIERPAVKSSQNPFEAEPVMATQGDAAPESRQVAILPSRRRLARMIGIAVAGGTVAGIVVGKLISNGNPEAANLDSLPTAWLDHAQLTLAPTRAAQLIEDARRCREPLARVAISHSSGSSGGVLSIRSGGYQSPQFALKETPSLVALPYPPPYSSGRGVLTIVGEASGVIVGLQPQRTISNLEDTVILPVWWNPTQTCS